MQKLLLVCVAGALGTGLRYLVGVGCVRFLGTGFPYGTLAVNVLGCFLMAGVMQAATNADVISETTRTILTTGFMGGLTTYSAFNFESSRFVTERAWGLLALNVAGTLVLCFIAGLMGVVAARRFAT
jgi:CrcB protein